MGLTKPDIFIIPASSGNGAIIYAPLKNYAFWVDDEYAEVCRYYLSEGEMPAAGYNDLKTRLDNLIQSSSLPVKPSTFRISDSLVILPSQICNLGCSYCYAANAHCKAVMSKETIRKSIDLLFDVDGNTKRISFIGGGEPLCTWELLKYSVEYAEDCAARKSVKVRFSMTTNGTLLDNDKAVWLKSHGFSICVSFEILPSVQNILRPFANGLGSFDSVDKGLRTLFENGIIPSLRATITEDDVSQMPEMINYVHERYPEIRKVHFEHVSGNLSSPKEYYRTFIINFEEAFILARSYGIELSNSIIHSMKYLREVFCNGEFCVTPEGDCVSCHRVSGNHEANYDFFRYGNVFDAELIDNVSSVKQNKLALRSPCEGCFARWHCAGGCAYNRKIYSDEYLDMLCDFTRGLIQSHLELIYGIGR